MRHRHHLSQDLPHLRFAATSRAIVSWIPSAPSSKSGQQCETTSTGHLQNPLCTSELTSCFPTDSRSVGNYQVRHRILKILTLSNAQQPSGCSVLFVIQPNIWRTHAHWGHHFFHNTAVALWYSTTPPSLLRTDGHWLSGKKFNNILISVMSQAFAFEIGHCVFSECKVLLMLTALQNACIHNSA